MTSMSRILGGAALMALLPLAAFANKADDTVRIAFAKDLDTPNAYFSSARESTIFQFSINDRLVERDANGEWGGVVAEEFKWVDDVTLEFKIREGVTFHNDEQVTADDAVFTFNHFSDPATGVAMPNTVNWIKNAEKIDDLTFRVHLKAPMPVALDYIASSIPVYPAKYYQEVGAEGYAKNPIGTGRYKVKSIEPGRGYVLEAYEGYAELGPLRKKAPIKTVEVRSIPDVNTQIADLFSGSVDFMWQVPEDQAQRITSRGGYTVTQAPSVRFGYLSMDAMGRSGFEPFKDKRVRQAVNHAIDRTAVRDAFFAPTSEIINSICNPLQFGCEQDVTSYDYDPEKAKALLKDAGYEKGFTVDFYAYRDRQAAEAMAQMLDEVGIKANMTFLQYSAIAEKTLKDEVPMSFMTWGSGSILDVSASTSKFFDGSAIDDVKDPALTALLKTADTTTDETVRKENYSKALRQVADEAYWVPLWTYTSNYVFSPELDYTPNADEYVRFYEMSWK